MSDSLHKENYLRDAVSLIENEADRLAVERELSLHIDERTKYYQEIGYDEETSAQKAVEQMGEPELIAPAFSKLHPKGRVWTAVLLILLLLVLLFFYWTYIIWRTSDCEIGSVIEIPILLCFFGLSRLGKKRLNRFLCGLPMALFLLSFPQYCMSCTSGGEVCSGIVMIVSCIVTGDLVCLNTFPLVGGITVAPWLTSATTALYVFFFLLLVAEFVSVCRLHEPPYSLFDKKASKVISIVQKTVCIGLAVVTVLFWNPLFSVPTELPKDENYDTIVIIQSDTPCSIEEIRPEDILILEADYDLDCYIFAWWPVSPRVYLAYDSMWESLQLNCGNKLQYRVHKAIILPQITKDYVYITAFDSYASVVLDASGSVYLPNLHEFVTVSTEDWQKTESVDIVNIDINQYDCVEIRVNEPA